MTLGCLVGRLMPRLLLKQQRVALPAMSFSSTKEGKPYIVSPTLLGRSIATLLTFVFVLDYSQPAITSCI